jgi:hypothetical protein
MKKEIPNIVKYKDIITKRTLTNFINNIEKDIKTLTNKIKEKKSVLKKLKNK